MSNPTTCATARSHHSFDLDRAMRTSRSTIASVPQPFRVLVRLLLWCRDGLGAMLGSQAHEYRRALEACTALLLLMGLAAVASLGIPPVVTVSGGLSVAVLFVVAHSFVLAYECCEA